jgi:hypothetical protein
MKLTLGQAAKEVGISKPSLSVAIKKGRLSAYKNENGTYEIDPAELFRVYPPKTNTNSSANPVTLTTPNPKKTGVSVADNEVLALLLAERDKLIEEKEKTIRRLEEEKEKVREDLDDQKVQTNRITLLLENKTSGGGEWQKSIDALEKRLTNQESAITERREKEQRILKQNRALKKTLEEERKKSFWKKVFG